MLQCNEPSTWQLSNFGCLTQANHLQQTTRKPNTCSVLQGCGFESQLQSIFFFIFVFYLGIADGAKVGLKQLMLTYGTLKDSTVSVTGTYPIKHHFIEFYTEQ